jgi:hypothetical protein
VPEAILFFLLLPLRHMQLRNPTDDPPQANQLLAAMKLAQLWWNRARFSRQPRTGVTNHQTQAAEDERLVLHLEYSPEHLPERVTADAVFLLSMSEPRAKRAAIRGAHGPPVEARLLDKGPCRPPAHSRRRHGNPVDAAFFHGLVPTDFIEAAAPKELASP